MTSPAQFDALRTVACERYPKYADLILEVPNEAITITTDPTTGALKVSFQITMPVELDTITVKTTIGPPNGPR